MSACGDSNSTNPMSPPHATSRCANSKPKRPPPITPKRFNRFFTPRSSSGHSSHSSNARRRLRDITKTAINRNWPKKTERVLPSSTDGHQDLEPTVPPTPESTVQKRKLESSQPSSPFAPSSPCKRPRINDLPNTEIPSSPPLPLILEDDSLPTAASSPLRSDSPEIIFSKPLRLLNSSSTTLRVLERSFGGYDTLGRGWRNDYCGGILFHNSSISWI
jgi:hypothetical protein